MIDCRSPTAVILPTTFLDGMFCQVIVWKGERFTASSNRSRERALEKALMLITNKERELHAKRSLDLV